jgi:hypothetical protein
MPHFQASATGVPVVSDEIVVAAAGTDPVDDVLRELW